MKIPTVKIFERYFRGLAKEKSEPIEAAEPTNVVESIEAPERDPYEILFSQWAGETGLVKGFPQYNDNMITSWKLGTPNECGGIASIFRMGSNKRSYF